VVTADIVTGSGEVVRHVQRFLPLPEGGVRVEEEATIPEALTDLPRVGTVMEVVPGFEQLEWFGNGPHETYPDRARGGRIGRWRSTVTEQHVPYIRPQENGGHAGVRWLELADRGGRRFRVALDEPRQVSVTHFRAADLDAATHFGELRPRTETVIHLDARHRGVGVGSCGPDTLPQYRFGPGTYRWSWAVNASGWHG
jgi:beta-galactosidase